MATGSTSAYRIFDSVKLKGVEIWAANAAGDTSNSVLIEYNGLNNIVSSAGMSFSDTAMGLSDVAHVRAIPPVGSLASFWQGPGTGQDLFRIEGPKGSIVDVELEFTFADSEPPQGVGAAVSGATIGQIYLRALDSTSTAVLQPIGYDTI